MATDYPSDWDSRRKTVYQRDGYTCQNCGAKGGPKGDTELHAHHIVQKSQGGTHQPSNLQTLCKKCHNAIHYDSIKAPTHGREGGITPSGGVFLSKNDPIRRNLRKFHAIIIAPLIILSLLIYFGGAFQWSPATTLVNGVLASWGYLLVIGIPTQFFGVKYLKLLVKVVSLITVILFILYKMNDD